MTPPGLCWQNDWPFPKWPAQNALNLNMKKTHTSSKSSLRSSKPTLLYSSQGSWQGSQGGFEVSVRGGHLREWLALAQREANVQADLWGHSVSGHCAVGSSRWTDPGPLLLLAGTDGVIVCFSPGDNNIRRLPKGYLWLNWCLSKVWERGLTVCANDW